MKLIEWIKKIIWKLTWRKKLCCECSGIFCIGNHGPCYSCREGSNFEYGEMIPEPVLETGCDYEYVFKGWGQIDPVPSEPRRIKHGTAKGNPWILPKGKPMVIYDREYDDEGRLKRFKLMPADEEAEE